MSVQGSVVVNASDGNEALVHEAMSSLMRAANSWAHMTRAGAGGWGKCLPIKVCCSFMWWLPPDAVRVSEVGSGLHELLLVRQVAFGPDSGHLFPVSLLVHTSTGAARVLEIKDRLVGFEPGFMASLPVSLCVMLDWLLYGHYSRLSDNPSWQVDADDVIDVGNGYTVDSGRFLRYVTFNRFDCVCEGFDDFFHFADDGESGIVVAEDAVPVDTVMVETAEPVRIGYSPSVGSGPAELHRAALARQIIRTLDDSSDGSSDGSDSEIEVISINS